LVNVLSGVALICGPSSGPIFRADHTVIDRGYHRLLIDTISGAGLQGPVSTPEQSRLATLRGCGHPEPLSAI